MPVLPPPKMSTRTIHVLVLACFLVDLAAWRESGAQFSDSGTAFATGRLAPLTKGISARLARTAPKVRHLASSPEKEAEAPKSTKSGRGLAALAIGGVAGSLGGALGLGGGFLVVPALTSLLDVDPKLAIGTSSFVVLSVSAIACGTYVARGLASWRAAGIIALTALITARLGATLTAKANSKTLKKVFGGWLLIVSSLIGAKASGLLVGGASIPSAGASAAMLPLAGLGGVTGFISGLLGVGGGTVLVPSLTLGFGFPQAEAQGCALLGMVPPAVVSTTTHWRNGNVDRSLVVMAVIGALLGGALGGSLASSLPENALRAVFAVVLGLVAVKYLRS
mmetsp:Transcript_16326/g.35776  ORF Transcript_16326/g.35776 Transcript_16326/m.35776 type:complete len:337 (+) Transcript_16326:101-1111(+)|eukprot:CAMPEP_0170618278 /NCGR_PEP_ID=MMETSP0224-20130122/26874_1 /TAXON_ID=285029 /ORGANISM="Togula jolla, Strain CCCM 725" /LENGTH=336 /DNA_ID=CAMNT_0010944243 /DNA_START=101 /DNA_END=1111 /DNA_ORIENTATION=+